MLAQREGKGITLTIFNLGAIKCWEGGGTKPWPLYPENSPVTHCRGR